MVNMIHCFELRILLEKWYILGETSEEAREFLWSHYGGSRQRFGTRS